MNECGMDEVGTDATGAKVARERSPAGSGNMGGGYTL